MNCKFNLRQGIRAASSDHQGQVIFQPEVLEDHPEVSFDELIEQFGSVANASTQAGIPYFNTRTNERAITGETAHDWRINVVTTAQALSGAIDSAPDIEAVALHINRSPCEIRDAFGSREGLLREAGIDPVETADVTPIHEKTATIRNAARDLEAIPSPVYVAHQSRFTVEEVTSWFNSWTVAVEASYGTAGNPESLAEETIHDEGATNGGKEIAQIAASRVQTAESISGYPYPDPETELIDSIERLANQIGHRPSTKEVIEYLPYDWVDFADIFSGLDPTEIAIQRASVLSERDLSPTGSLHRQPEVAEDDIPTHTDLLRDIHIVHIRGQDDVHSDFDDRGILDKYHFEVQFGSFEDAVAAHEELDLSDYREAREFDETPLIQDTVEELGTVLGRAPTVAETTEITDYGISDFIKKFDSWRVVVDQHPPLDAWTNQVLLNDITAVGQMTGRPPTPADIINSSDFPFTTYIRRFGSLPTVLHSVDVSITQDIPEEYLAVTFTRDVWERTERLVETSFSVEPAVYDDLWRLYHEFGTVPSSEQYDQYGLYDPSLVAFGSDWKQTLEDAGFTEKQTDTECNFDRAAFESELESLADSLELPVFPRDVECFTNYSAPTIATEYGTLEAAFEVVGIETRHLETPVETPQDVWKEHNEQTRKLLAGLQRLDKTDNRDVTYTDVRNDPDISTNWIYYAFDSYSDAADVAGIIDTPTHGQGTSVIDDTEEETSDSILNSMIAEVNNTDDTPADEH